VTKKPALAAARCAVVAAAAVMFFAAASFAAATPATEIARKILPNGTIEIHYSNGDVKDVSLPSPAPAPQVTQGPSSSAVDQALPAGPDIRGLDPATRAKYAAALQAYYDYRISGYNHRDAVFAWQFFSSKIIFWVVLLIVAAGILFSAIQFFRPAASQKSEVTEMEASLQGVKVSSPILGVVILTLSIAFFYLYLVYVYPINNTF
jgi:hypothetical protein